MKRFKYLLVALISVMGLVSLSSCDKDEKYTNLDVWINLSPDMLEYVTPTIELTVNGGERIKQTLTASDFEETDGYATHFETGTKVNLYRYLYHGRYDNSKIEGTVAVSYSLKPGATFNKDLYIFVNSIYLRYTLMNKTAYTENFELNNTLEFPDKAGAEEFLKNFCSRTYESSFSAEMK